MSSKNTALMIILVAILVSAAILSEFEISDSPKPVEKYSSNEKEFDSEVQKRNQKEQVKLTIDKDRNVLVQNMRMPLAENWEFIEDMRDIPKNMIDTKNIPETGKLALSDLSFFLNEAERCLMIYGGMQNYQHKSKNIFSPIFFGTLVTEWSANGAFGPHIFNRDNIRGRYLNSNPSSIFVEEFRMVSAKIPSMILMSENFFVPLSNKCINDFWTMIAESEVEIDKGGEGFVMIDSYQDLNGEIVFLNYSRMDRIYLDPHTGDRQKKDQILNKVSGGLIFKEPGHTEKQFNPNFNNIKGDVMFYKNMIFAMNTEGKLQMTHLNINGTLYKELDLQGVSNTPDSLDSYLHDYIVKNNVLYYITGEFCNEYRAECDLDLYKYDLQTEVNIKLAEELPVRNITSVENDRIYMDHREGDAGCVWGQIYSTQTSSFGSATEEFRDGYCEGEEGSFEDFKSNFERAGQPIRTFKIPIKNSRIDIEKIQSEEWIIKTESERKEWQSSMKVAIE